MAQCRPLAALPSLALVPALLYGCSPPNPEPETVPGEGAGARQSLEARSKPKERLVHRETFDAPFLEPSAWIEDSYGEASPWNVDAFDEDGAFFVRRGGESFLSSLRSFRSFRKSYTYGESGWITVELYGRDNDKDGVPETGGHFQSEAGKAKLVSKRHYDGAILRSTHPLPARYRVEVTVSNIDFGGRRDGSWERSGKLNGYTGNESAGPWRFRDDDLAPIPAVTQNGLYFLCITDYARPAPHNNVFIHHHRKVVMDTDNNVPAWSSVWSPKLGAPEMEGSQYISMIWLGGDSFGSPWNGNELFSFTPGGFRSGPIFADQYLFGERYVFSIERDHAAYTMSVKGRFARGGERTYTATRYFRDKPATWHYNQTDDEYNGAHDEIVDFDGRPSHTWPAGSAYPDHFILGDPHINFYQGTAEFDDLSLFLPEEDPGDQGDGSR